jgi:hypothetical protein
MQVIYTRPCRKTVKRSLDSLRSCRSDKVIKKSKWGRYYK